MLVQEMAPKDSLTRLAKMHLGRLGCVKGSQPYIVPFYFAYKNDCLYSFSTVGRKIEWMRANPLVCVEADEVVNSEKWESVIVFGHYEEIPDTPDAQSQRTFAHDLLTEKPIWWEPGYVKTILHGAERPLVPVYFRIHVVEITGHRATP